MPTSIPNGILIHPAVWPQYTNVTDRQTWQTGQRSDSIGRTVLQTVAQWPTVCTSSDKEEIRRDKTLAHKIDIDSVTGGVSQRVKSSRYTLDWYLSISQTGSARPTVLTRCCYNSSFPPHIGSLSSLSWSCRDIAAGHRVPEALDFLFHNFTRCWLIFMVALCNRETIYIFILFLLPSFFFFFFLA